MLNPLNRRVLAGGLIAGVLAGTVGPAFAEQRTRLFTIVTEKGEIVVALTKEDGALEAMPLRSAKRFAIVVR